jgi:hypothetical protein
MRYENSRNSKRKDRAETLRRKTVRAVKYQEAKA